MTWRSRGHLDIAATPTAAAAAAVHWVIEVSRASTVFSTNVLQRGCLPFFPLVLFVTPLSTAQLHIVCRFSRRPKHPNHSRKLLCGAALRQHWLHSLVSSAQLYSVGAEVENYVWPEHHANDQRVYARNKSPLPSIFV